MPKNTATEPLEAAVMDTPVEEYFATSRLIEIGGLSKRGATRLYNTLCYRTEYQTVRDVFQAVINWYPNPNYTGSNSSGISGMGSPSTEAFRKLLVSDGISVPPPKAPKVKED